MFNSGLAPTLWAVLASRAFPLQASGPHGSLGEDGPLGWGHRHSEASVPFSQAVLALRSKCCAGSMLHWRARILVGITADNGLCELAWPVVLR